MVGLEDVVDDTQLLWKYQVNEGTSYYKFKTKSTYLLHV